MDEATRKRLKKLTGKGNEGVRGSLNSNIPSIDIPTSPIPNKDGNPNQPQNTPVHKEFTVDVVLQGLMEVCADPGHPRFIDASKLLVDLKGWRTPQAVTVEALDPSSFVQVIAKAAIAYKGVASFLRDHIAPRVHKASSDEGA
jgi:hypothetical protein